MSKYSDVSSIRWKTNSTWKKFYNKSTDTVVKDAKKLEKFTVEMLHKLLLKDEVKLIKSSDVEKEESSSKGRKRKGLASEESSVKKIEI